mmetsp:Transcript_67052/g.175821  ORF Transcript_67052/g.175821 Transcript_67052/m.175821 type:complete len:286 (+) Transcript_67052:425-1282(+)
MLVVTSHEFLEELPLPVRLLVVLSICEVLRVLLVGLLQRLRFADLVEWQRLPLELLAEARVRARQEDQSPAGDQVGRVSLVAAPTRHDAHREEDVQEQAELNLVHHGHEERPSEVVLPRLREDQEVAEARPREGGVDHDDARDEGRKGAEDEADHEVQREARRARPDAVEVLIFGLCEVEGHLLPVQMAEEDELQQHNVAGQLETMRRPPHAHELHVVVGEAREAIRQHAGDLLWVPDDRHDALVLPTGIVGQRTDHRSDEQREDHVEDEEDVLQKLLAPGHCLQ